jgi:predicted nucleic acid-binding protein
VSVLADTSVLVEHLRGAVPARALMRLRLDSGQLIAACNVSMIELALEMRKDEQQATGALLGALCWLPLDDAACEQANALASRFGDHPGIGVVDCAIAACAIVNDLELWTLNVGRYPMFPELRSAW